jgi:hypothetical protein
MAYSPKTSYLITFGGQACQDDSHAKIDILFRLMYGVKVIEEIGRRNRDHVHNQVVHFGTKV